MSELSNDELLETLDCFKEVYIDVCKDMLPIKFYVTSKEELRKRAEQAHKQIKVRLQKPKVDEKYIEKKAKELIMLVPIYMSAKDFIRQFVIEIQPQKLEVDEEEFKVEAEKLFERSKQFKVLYDAEVYLGALIKKIQPQKPDEEE